MFYKISSFLPITMYMWAGQNNTNQSYRVISLTVLKFKKKEISRINYDPHAMKASYGIRDCRTAVVPVSSAGVRSWWENSSPSLSLTVSTTVLVTAATSRPETQTHVIKSEEEVIKEQKCTCI